MIFSKIFPLPFTVRKFSGSIFLIFIVRQQELRSKWMAVSIFRRKGSKRTVCAIAIARNGAYKVLRYSNLQIAEEFEGVCQDILRETEERRGT